MIGALGQPREQRIVLPRTGSFQGLEPLHELSRLGRHCTQVPRDGLTFCFDERALHAPYGHLASKLALEVTALEGWRKPTSMRCRDQPVHYLRRGSRTSTGEGQ